ncbi:MAG: DinB family protein [Hydrogenophilales bacterium]|nr:DinB family protein [Hydrogenophilales bacterium]
MYTWKSHYVVQTDYQHWANEVLFSAIDHLKPEFLDSDQGLFFKSIHHTLDHMLLVSQVWQARLRGETLEPAPNYKAIQHPDWRELKNAMRKETRHLQDWLDRQPKAWFEGKITYVSSDGKMKDNWVRDVLNHLFTHYAHHRGQISAVLTRLEAPCPEMDFIYFRREMDKILAEP